MTPRERVLCALGRGTPDRVPYCELGIDAPIVRQVLGGATEAHTAGWYFGSAGTSGSTLSRESIPPGEEAETPARLEKALSCALGRDNICYRFLPPIPVERRAGKDGIQFYGDGHVRTEADLDRIVLPDPADEALYEPARRFLAERGEFAAVAAGRLGISPTYLAMGTENFCMALFERPRFVEAVLERFTTWSAEVLERACRLGFDFLWLADDVAFKSSTYFSPENYRRHILPHVRRVAERITLPWVMHSDGNILPILDDALRELRPSAIHPVEPEAMDIVEVKRRYGDRLCIIGNVSVHLLSTGTPGQVRDEVKRLLKEVAPGGGYILSSGNSLASYCRIENIRAMVEALREQGRYPISVST